MLGQFYQEIHHVPARRATLHEPQQGDEHSLFFPPQQVFNGLILWQGGQAGPLEQGVSHHRRGRVKEAGLQGFPPRVPHPPEPPKGEKGVSLVQERHAALHGLG